jgi:hypothetical protein
MGDLINARLLAIPHRIAFSAACSRQNLRQVNAAFVRPQQLA